MFPFVANDQFPGFPEISFSNNVILTVKEQISSHKLGSILLNRGKTLVGTHIIVWVILSSDIFFRALQLLCFPLTYYSDVIVGLSFVDAEIMRSKV